MCISLRIYTFGILKVTHTHTKTKDMKLRDTTNLGYLVSTVTLPNGKIETMVFDPKIDDECECIRASCLKIGFKNHTKMVQKYRANEEVVRLADLLKKANASMYIHANEPDNGSCNLDTVLIDFQGKRKDFIEKLVSLSGFSIEKITSGWHKGLHMVFFNYHGQANVRYQMVQTASEFLRNNGVKASVWYQMD